MNPSERVRYEPKGSNSILIGVRQLLAQSNRFLATSEQSASITDTTRFFTVPLHAAVYQIYFQTADDKKSLLPTIQAEVCETFHKVRSPEDSETWQATYRY
jgi:hypothetical protein